MLEILETGRRAAGIWIPGWEQGLPPLTEAPFPRAYRVAPRSNKKGPEQRTDTMRALAEEALSLYKLGHKKEALANFEEIARLKAERREVVAWALCNKALLLKELNREDEALRVCNEIVRRFGRAKEPALREVAAKALYEKEWLLCDLDRKDELLPVCEQFVRLFGTANEPAAREGMWATLLWKIDRLGVLGRKEEALATCVEFLRRFDDTANAARETMEAAIEAVLSAKKTLLSELGLSYNPADQPRITGEKDEGHVQGPLHDYFESRGVPEALQPKLAAKFDDLVTAEITGRDAAPVAEPATQEANTEAQAFAVALEAMTLKERRAALDAHYATRKENQWAKARGENPTPDQFRAWLDDVFPDRREIGMVLSDLRHLEKEAYDKLHNWSNKKPKLPKETIESFGLPSKRTAYDAERDAIAPAERKKLQRSLGRAQYHHARLG
jgi:tetratricopeptide (TPR) repeat protein